FAVTPIVDPCLTCDEFAFGDIDESGDEILFTGHEVWVATPELLGAIGVATTGADRDDAVLGLSRIADARLVDERLASGATGLAASADLPAADRVAPVLLWPETVADRGWETRTVGWLLADEAGGDLAGRADELRAAAGAALAIETRIEPAPQTSLRLLAIIVGGITALAVVGAAVTLEVAEGAADRRLLGAIGASPAVARSLAASGAALLAGTGALLALPTGYLALVALLAIPGVDLPAVVPWSALALVAALPIVAAAIGWFGATRAGARTGGAGTGGGRWSLLPTLLVLALTASACAVPGLEADESTTDVPPLTASDAAANDGAAPVPGCDQGLDAALGTWADVGFAGSIAVLGGDRPCIAAYGQADPAADRPNTTDTVFSIGSVTKAVTAAAVLDLIDRGLVDFDDPVRRHRPDLDGPVGELTMRQLLLHTSGLVGLHGRDHEPLDETAAVAAIAGLDLAFPAGRQYLYSNAGYSLLALVVEAVSDVGFRRYVTDRILVDGEGRPLGGFWDGEPAPTGPRAVGFPDGERPGHDGDFGGPHWALDGNGGVAMTAEQLARWTRALFTGGILSARATGWLTSTTTHLGPDVELPGWVRLDREVLGEVVIGASGGGGSIGHSVDVAWLPESGRVLVLAVNRRSVRSARLLDHVVPALVAGTGIPGPTPVPSLAPAELEAATGTWVAAGGGRVVVDADGDGLLASAEGPAIAALLPVPTDLVGEAAVNEDLAVAFARGETAEGREERAAFEAGFGPIRRIEVDGTVFEGELVTHLLVFVDDPDDGGERPIRVALALNGFGGVEGAAVDTRPPSVWLVGGGGTGTGDGTVYVPFEPAAGTPSVTLTVGSGPEGERLTIEGPEGTVTLERAAG
ncbi:MAG: serine hydrolase domain-containing protein, partial [Actinomycetota bacterium]